MVVVMMFGACACGAPLFKDVPRHGDGRPDERDRAQNIDTVHHEHRGQDNKPFGGCALQDGRAGVTRVEQFGRLKGRGRRVPAASVVRQCDEPEPCSVLRRE